MSTFPESDVGRVITDNATMQEFLSDWSGSRRGSARCVVQPENTQQVANLMRWCHFHRVPVVPQGGNTGLVGGATPDTSGSAVLLSMTRMSRVRHVDAINNSLTAEAGVILENIQKAAFEAGKLFPLSLGAQGSCTIGGNLATNAGGTGVVRYGNARELCLGLEIVTPTGEIYDGLRGLRKDNTGYDLRNLYIGSEGTLGVITAATLKLFPVPKASVTALAAVASPRDAVTLLELTQEFLGFGLTAFELMSGYCVELVRKAYPDSARPFPKEPEWTVLIESSDLISGERAAQRFEEMMVLAFERNIIQDAAVAQSISQSQQFWQLRERIGLCQPPNLKHDISLPISAIASFIPSMNERITQRFPNCKPVVLGHLGDGNLHYNIELPTQLGDEEKFHMQQTINTMVHDEVERLKGSMSAEHGIGSAKVEKLRKYKSPVGLNIMASIKSSLDPLNLMNPGKIFAHE